MHKPVLLITQLALLTLPMLAVPALAQKIGIDVQDGKAEEGALANLEKLAQAEQEKWISLFDGKTLGAWKVTAFGGGAEPKVEPKFRENKAAITVGTGVALSGFNYTKEFPKTNYEISLEMMKIEGSDFACGITFPIGDSFASLILGGWGGQVVGISSVNMMDASENETTTSMAFPKEKWFKIRLRVTPTTVTAWVNEKEKVNLTLKGKLITLRHGEISKSMPLGISAYQTSAAYREIKYRKIEDK